MQRTKNHYIVTYVRGHMSVINVIFSCMHNVSTREHPAILKFGGTVASPLPLGLCLLCSKIWLLCFLVFP